MAHVLLRHRDIPDIKKIDVYKKNGGLAAFKNAVSKMQPNEVIDVVKNSGLRGRGGAGHSHMRVRKGGGGFVLELSREEPVNRHRPAADVLFWSMAEQVRQNAEASVEWSPTDADIAEISGMFAP